MNAAEPKDRPSRSTGKATRTSFFGKRNAALFHERLALFRLVDVCEGVSMSTNVPATRLVSLSLFRRSATVLSTEINVDKLRRIQQKHDVAGLAGIPQ